MKIATSVLCTSGGGKKNKKRFSVESWAKRFDSEEAFEKHLKARCARRKVWCVPFAVARSITGTEQARVGVVPHDGHETTLTAGTVMHGSRLPLMYWFTAIHLLTSTKKAISALEMQRQLGHKRHQPIWRMMHKLRSVMDIRDEKYRLKGTTELDEGYFTTPRTRPVTTSP